MTEEIEVPLEDVQEKMHHHALHGGDHESKDRSWVIWGALLSAVIAVLAAIAALQSGHHANEAMLEQIHASDQWAFYQAKSIKAALLETRQELLVALGKSHESPADLKEKLAEYRTQQAEIQADAKKAEQESHVNFHLHEILAKAVTFFQIAIAITAIAVLSNRKWFLAGALGFAVIGSYFLITGSF